MIRKNSVISTIMSIKYELNTINKKYILQKILYNRYRKKVKKYIESIRYIDLDKNFFEDFSVFLLSTNIISNDKVMVNENTFKIVIDINNDSIIIRSNNRDYDTFNIEYISLIDNNTYRINKSFDKDYILNDCLSELYKDSVDYKIYTNLLEELYKFIIDIFIKYIDEEE